jgi:hypothetical protein
MLKQANKALSTITDGLKSSPAFLALILLNVLVLGLVAFAVHEQRAQTYSLLERCFGN